ncbi:hypothetical protein J4E83_008977 [Alternaria metachromatica]|uniref:uncharacterized protein n=1 Tax=Alternaria metachromatica TaxID=283354 RepID=UPI0020C4F846|nr:uncharacterized protein J4E83_008977 [Alternaria metachromatica]KAI4608938.1 hypothetical protein J4E83_008977 [Alternaria metachromatica]
MAPRTVYTFGGRYKSIAAVEDAPFAEFISVRETGLKLNVVHPVPVAYLRDLNSRERDAVHKHITSQLFSNSYKAVGFAKAAEETLGLLETVQQDMDHDRSTAADLTTTDATSNRTYHTTREHQESRGKHSSMHVEADTNVMSGSRSGALERSRNIDKWKSTVPPGYPPPSVSTPRSVFQSKSGSRSRSSSTSRMRKPSRHTDFLKDAKLDEKTRIIVVEHSAASRELTLQEEHLASLESLALTVTSSAARRDLYGAIRKARSAVEKVRVLERKCKGALSDSRALVVDALELADDLWETSDAAADEASTVSSPKTISSRTTDSSRTTGTSPTQRSTSTAPSEPESLVPARFASPSEVVSLKQELQKIDDSLSESMRTLNRVITRSSSRAGVIKSIDRARACLDKLHVARERFSGLDDEKIRKFGAATLAIARTRHQEVLRVLDAAKQEQLRLDGPTQAKGSGGTRDTERQQPPRMEEELNQTIHRISELGLADAKELLRQQKDALDQIVPHRVAETHNGHRQMGPSLYDQFLQAGAPEAYGEPTSSVTGLPPSRYLDWDEYTCAQYFESSWSWEDWE